MVEHNHSTIMTVQSQSTYQPVDVETELWFLQREDKHEAEKPYKLRYDPGEDVPRSNCTNELVHQITVHDIRGREGDFTIEREGFTVSRLVTKLTPEEFDDDKKIQEVYYAELRELLK